MTTAVAQAPQLTERLDRVAVGFAQETLEVIDLVLLGMLRGDWLELERRARRGLELDRETGHPVTKDDLHAAATSFRYAHGLISGEDFLRWLRERELIVRDLGSYLRRGLVSEAAGDGPPGDGAPERGGVGEGPLAEILWPEAVCSGWLASLASAAGDLLVADSLVTAASPAEGPDQPDVPGEVLELAATAAASGVAERPVEELRARLGRLAKLRLAMARLRRQVAEPAALERVVASHGLEWLSVNGSELGFATEGAALEARLLLTVDGRDAQTVARLAGSRSLGAPLARQLLIADAPAELAGAIVAAAPGEVIGPWSEGAAQRLLLVEAKQPASIGTSSIREMAISERLADVLKRNGAGRLERPLPL